MLVSYSIVYVMNRLFRYALMSGSVCVLLFEDLFSLPPSLALLELVEPATLDDWITEREDWLRES